MLNRYISLTLALRYLNPLRSYFSIITLICLLGVALGVMVLVVVLSVMSGLQKDMQGRLLAFSPHLQVNYHYTEDMAATINDWESVIGLLNQVPEVESSYGVIEDNALLDFRSTRRAGGFRAIDTNNEQQINDLKSLIRDGTFELDLGEKAVISSLLADSLGIQVGDTLGALTLRNLDDITSAYEQVEKELLVKRAPEAIKTLASFPKLGKTSAQNISWTPAEVDEALTMLNVLMEKSRHSEVEILSEMCSMLLSGEEEGSRVAYPADIANEWSSRLDELNKLNKSEEDLASFMQMKELVLPKDLEFIGIYQASQHVISPDLFVPLGIGQDLLNYTDNCVQSIALRVKDPYFLDTVKENVEKALPPLPEPARWKITTWKDKYENWFSLMQMERSMMNFVLSFISLISAFCIMAVMFTVSIQRKKELAVIKALGATPSQIIRVFLWQGVIIGIIGSILGIALGLLVLHYRVHIHAFLSSAGFDPFPMDFHGMEMPANIEPVELLIQASKAFVMVVIASVVPAIITAYQDPAKSLRSL